MISRFYVICKVCGSHHTLRVQLGYAKEQKHRFQCHHCNEPIVFCMFPDRLDAEGAEPTDKEHGDDGKTNYQYLSPDFVADATNARDPTYFGSLALMDAVFNKPEIKRAITRLPQGQLPKEGWFALTNARPSWEGLQVCWRLERSGKYFLAGRNLKSLEPAAGTSSWLAAVMLGHRLFGKNQSLLKEVLQIIKNNKVEAARLVLEYEYQWVSDFMEAQFQVFSEFFKRWEAFSQVYIYIGFEIKMPSDAAATSVDFESVRGFYSMAQEFFAKQVRLLTALNNMKAGRAFDQLSKITLRKYFDTDNAKRCDNFKDNLIFASAASEFDSSLRNAEAHNWLRANAEAQFLQYHQGGAGAAVQLKYVEYLRKSVALFRQICHLMQVEAILKNLARDTADGLLCK